MAGSGVWGRQGGSEEVGLPIGGAERLGFLRVVPAPRMPVLADNAACAWRQIRCIPTGVAETNHHHSSASIRLLTTKRSLHIYGARPNRAGIPRADSLPHSQQNQTKQLRTCGNPPSCEPSAVARSLSNRPTVASWFLGQGTFLDRFIFRYSRPSWSHQRNPPRWCASEPTRS